MSNKVVTFSGHNTMSDKERISAFMDGELSRHEHDELLTQTISNDELQSSWQLNHLIRDAMQNHLPEQFEYPLSTRVAAEIDKEPTILAPANIRHRWMQPVIGIAVAASVASIALLGLYTNQAEQGATPVLAQKQIMTQKQMNVAQQQSKPEEYDTYLANHAEFSTGNRMQSFMPYARVVGYEQNK